MSNIVILTTNIHGDNTFYEYYYPGEAEDAIKKISMTDRLQGAIIKGRFFGTMNWENLLERIKRTRNWDL